MGVPPRELTPGDDATFEWKGRTRVSLVRVCIRARAATITWSRIPALYPMVLTPAVSLAAGFGGAMLVASALPVAGALGVMAAAAGGFLSPILAYSYWQRRSGVARLELDVDGLRIEAFGTTTRKPIDLVKRALARTGLGVDGREWRLVLEAADADLETPIAFVDERDALDVADRLDAVVARLRSRDGYR